MNKFIFDVDGTLTPSRQHMDSEFEKYFLEFCSNNDVYLVTGSDHPKTVEQLGNDICLTVKRLYNCSGSEVWEGNTNTYSGNWQLPPDVRAWLETQLVESNFVLRTGNHIEERSGMVNFSIVGRNATQSERKLYIAWDHNVGERSHICHLFNSIFKGIIATAGGETGIDIGPTGADKRQILKDFDTTDTLYFFGDSMEPMGNDYLLAKAIVDKNMGSCYTVQDWQHTWKLLKDGESDRLRMQVHAPRSNTEEKTS